MNVRGQFGDKTLRLWKLDYIAGFTQAARDIQSGAAARATFGSFAMSAYAVGYRAGVESAGVRQ